MNRIDDLTYLVRSLQTERGETFNFEASASEDALFRKFRALVNTRPPN